MCFNARGVPSPPVTLANSSLMGENAGPSAGLAVSALALSGMAGDFEIMRWLAPSLMPLGGSFVGDKG